MAVETEEVVVETIISNKIDNHPVDINHKGNSSKGFLNSLQAISSLWVIPVAAEVVTNNHRTQVVQAMIIGVVEIIAVFRVDGLKLVILIVSCNDFGF